MGSSIESCCGESGSRNKLEKKKTLTNGNTTASVSEKGISNVSPFNFKVGANGLVEFSEQDIFRILGSMILVSKETHLDDF